ncbi:HNRNPR [Cordylochernes scorpioides]|uniref:HNRNPR n=1 Tax=Cordylochernes scorpioides TaxID=51811 RepID=A0ABY6JXN8_9ARAC|nr:HNRNPR [Cordylochernes scorpioides]
MDIFEEQRIYIKFCFKLKKGATETYELIKEAFGDAALSRSRTFEWFSRFLKGREKVNDDQHTGRPRSLRCEENKFKIKELIKSNRIISIKDLSSETGLSYDPETKRQSSQWIERGEPKPKKARFTKSKDKTLLVTFFDINVLGQAFNHTDPSSTLFPDLAPNDFFLYPKLKMKLKGRKFDNVDMMQAESKATLRNLSKSDFISCFDNWKKRWNSIKSTRTRLDCVEGLFYLPTMSTAPEAKYRGLDNYEIRKGKELKVNVSVPNLRLFVGNIPKSKSKEEILEEFTKLTAGLVDVIIYSSPDDKKKNRGFCFLEYECHKSASLAKRRLGTGRVKVWACDIIVDWADPQEEPDEETMAKVLLASVTFSVPISEWST